MPLRRGKQIQPMHSRSMDTFLSGTLRLLPICPVCFEPLWCSMTIFPGGIHQRLQTCPSCSTCHLSINQSGSGIPRKSPPWIQCSRPPTDSTSRLGIGMCPKSPVWPTCLRIILLASDIGNIPLFSINPCRTGIRPRSPTWLACFLVPSPLIRRYVGV